MVTILWEEGFWGNSKSILSPPVAAMLLVFTVTIILRLWFQRLPGWCGGGWVQIGQVKTPQSSLQVSHFSCTNTFQIVASFWLRSRILKSWLWHFFPSVLIAFNGGTDFWWFLFYHSRILLPFVFFYTNYLWRIK